MHRFSFFKKNKMCSVRARFSFVFIVTFAMHTTLSILFFFNKRQDWFASQSIDMQHYIYVSARIILYICLLLYVR